MGIRVATWPHLAASLKTAVCLLLTYNLQYSSDGPRPKRGNCGQLQQSSSVEVASLVAHTTGDGSRTASPPPRLPKPDQADSQSQQARHSPQASCLGYLRDRFVQAKNLGTKLQNSSLPHYETKWLSLTTHFSECGLAGVVKGT